jgi:hypothetical protein
LGGLHAVLGDIGGRVPDRDLAKTTSVDVVANVTSGGLDIGSRLVGILLVVDHLVSGEKGSNIVILGKHLNGSEDALEIVGIVRKVRVASVDGILGVVDIEHDVDAGILQSLHTLVMIGLVVNGVDSDCVDAKVLELLDITEADVRISQRIEVG